MSDLRLAKDDPRYPELLRKIADAPDDLCVRGTLRHDPRAVAVVGTREPTTWGGEVTRRIVTMLVKDGWSIVSGLAKGIDTIAHRAALDAGGHTVAVLAHGLSMPVYPAVNKSLAEDIVGAGGALVTEMAPHAEANRASFVQRNRIQSGMCVGTIVVQTDVRGGTMHTARWTLMQGRFLAAVVPQEWNRDEPKCAGPRLLTEATGPVVATALGAPNAYTRLLEARFRDRPPAFAIRGKQDYQALLDELDGAAMDHMAVPRIKLREPSASS